MDDFKRWYFQFPIVSRTFIAVVVVLTLVASVIYPGIVNYIYLSREKLMGIQIWRLFTNFFFIGTFGPSIIWEFVYLYFATTRLESLFTERSVDEQLWLYIINMSLLSVVGLIFNPSYMFMAHPLLFSFVYIWCKRKPFEQVQFFFGLKFQSGYFPFILIALHLIMGQSIIDDLYGLAVGHAYIFLKDIYPAKSQKHFFRTPQFFTRFVNKYITKVQAHNYVNPNDEQQQQQQNRWRTFQGQGVRIG